VRGGAVWRGVDYAAETTGEKMGVEAAGRRLIIFCNAISMRNL